MHVDGTAKTCHYIFAGQWAFMVEQQYTVSVCKGNHEDVQLMLHLTERWGPSFDVSKFTALSKLIMHLFFHNCYAWDTGEYRTISSYMNMPSPSTRNIHLTIYVNEIGVIRDRLMNLLRELGQLFYTEGAGSYLSLRLLSLIAYRGC